jgi:hypothetical protein
LYIKPSGLIFFIPRTAWRNFKKIDLQEIGTAGEIKFQQGTPQVEE